MVLSQIAGGKACNHQVSGSGTIPMSMIGQTISDYKVTGKLGEGWDEAAPDR